MIDSSALQSLSIDEIRAKIAGVDKEVPLLNGKTRPYINFDNAATTPPFKSVLEKVTAFSEWYASVHRGTGFKSLLSTQVYEESRKKVMQFVGRQDKERVVIFTCNTTCSINKLCQHMELGDNEVILLSLAEHHSNMLPWRVNCPVEQVDLFDEQDNFSCQKLEDVLRTSKKKVRLLAITGASNVTGSMPAIREVSRIVHKYGAELLVDAAQLIASRPVDMLAMDHPERIDYLAFSAHKMYAPFGVGVLIGPAEIFRKGRPYQVGGGTVDLVTLEDIQWTEVPEREEAGSPNIIGVVALVEAIEVLNRIGWNFIVNHNRLLTKRLLEGLRSIPGVTIYGNSDLDSPVDRVGVVSFNAKEIPHALLAAILGYEWGIGVRNGCFCAHPYGIKLLGIDKEQLKHHAELIRDGDWTKAPGMVRVSFGLYNTEEEINFFIKALKTILTNGPVGRYTMNVKTGEYAPQGKAVDFNKVFPSQDN
ncbi:MAG: aminotransferase class V-fold PLP-dependent enzyme [Candidatus Omnitrophota bacterium]